MSILNSDYKGFNDTKNNERKKLQNAETVNTFLKYKDIRNYVNKYKKESNVELANNICTTSLKGDWRSTGDIKYIGTDVSPDILCVRNDDQIEYHTLKNTINDNPILKFCTTETSQDFKNACECMINVSYNMHTNILNKINSKLNNAGLYINKTNEEMNDQLRKTWDTGNINYKNTLRDEKRWSKCNITSMAPNIKCKNSIGNGWKDGGNTKQCSTTTNQNTCIREEVQYNDDHDKWMKTRISPPEAGKSNIDIINYKTNIIKNDIKCCKDNCKLLYTQAACDIACDQTIINNKSTDFLIPLTK